MLRHYDKIGLLVPSYREDNGYRCYTAPDLAKLQQIVALKYFGFSLSTIKNILEKHNNIYAHLQAQQQVIKKRSDHLQQVHQVLEGFKSGKFTQLEINLEGAQWVAKHWRPTRLVDELPSPPTLSQREQPSVLM